MAFSPNVPVVAPGDLITAAHINNIRANLDRLDTTGVDLAGGIMSGNLQVGGDPTATAAGALLRVDGVVSSRINSSALATPNLSLNRAGSPASDVGGLFVDFRRAAAAGSATGSIGSITIDTGGAAVKYNTTSDGRLKDVVGDVDDPVGVVGRLRPRRLRWKADPAGDVFDGFIAQEVADVVPAAVSGDPDGDPDDAPMQLDMSRLVPVLVACVQNLARQVDELQARLDGAV
jgi:hypothetical protein